MSGETKTQVSGWTIDTYAAHNETLWQGAERERATRYRFEDRISELQDALTKAEDRRYTEVATEREKALKIKETADLAALGLAREIQTYKDEKANELREQINSERGLYATKGDLTAAIEKVEATLKPIAEYIASDRGRGAGFSIGWQVLLAGAAILAALYSGILGNRQAPLPTTPPVYYVPGPPLPIAPSTNAPAR